MPFARGLQREALAESLTELLEVTPDLVAIITPDGRAMYVNRAGRQLLGVREREDISEQTFLRHEAIPAALREGVWKGETVLLRTDGQEIQVSLVLRVHRAPDGTAQWLSALARDIRDITERKRMEQALQKAEEEMEISGDRRAPASGEGAASSQRRMGTMCCGPFRRPSRHVRSSVADDGRVVFSVELPSL